MDGVRPTIVCALDHSPGSVPLARVAVRLGAVLGAQLEFLHVVPGGDRGEMLAARTMLDRVCHAAGAITGERRVVRYGDPARRAAAVAEEREAALIVVGTRGDGSSPDAVVGSVSQRLAADAPCPVLVVPPHLAHEVRPERWRERTVVCGLDGSGPGWGAARHAATLAARLDGSLMLVTIGLGGRASDDDVARALSRAGVAVDVRRDVRGGDPAWELERVASAITAPVIAIGSRGLGPPHDGLLGTVAQRVLRAARRPTLIFPATSFAGAGG